MASREQMNQAFVVGSVTFSPTPMQKFSLHEYKESPAEEAAEEQSRGEHYEQAFEHAGRANEKQVTEASVDAEQLAMGIEVEKEHTTDPAIAKRIALDHLAEIGDYYSRLKKMEDEAKSGATEKEGD